MKINAREQTLKILININTRDAYSNLEINRYLDGDRDHRDENLIRELVYGVLENKKYLDYIISKASKVKIGKIHNNILEILRIGLYQVIFMEKIPASAAVNEAVELAKKYGHKGTVAYVNGMLRNILRNKDKFTNIETDNRIEYISIRYSHPLYMVKGWADEFGLDFTEKLCQANNSRPLLNIRVNTLKTDKKDLIKVLEDKGYHCVEGRYAEDCLEVTNPHGITKIEEFKEGLFIIQDEASILVSQIINPKENSMVLDLCSAPGGKTTHLAQIMKNKGYILARDIYQHKIALVGENAKRLGIDIIRPEVFDALKMDDDLANKFDYCLLDAPCSGLGIIRRKPEIKWNRGQGDSKKLAQLQHKMITNAGNYLKIGGILVYSTCTIGKEENIMVVERFIKENPGFKLMDISNRFKYRGKLTSLEKGYLQLYPHIHGTDGFFIARLVKEE